MSDKADPARSEPQPASCAHRIDAPEPATGNYFVSTYPPFSCWSEDTVGDFRTALASAPSSERTLGLYVHIPFCVDRCHYCYYLSHDDRLAQIDEYLRALSTELSLYSKLLGLAGRRPGFVYFGGGTPSLLATTRVERLLDSLQKSFDWSQALEVTFECAPRSVTEAKLLALRQRGVTRISLGVQQMDDQVLQASGRVHLIADVERAYALIRDVGFDLVNLDLMVGMVGETERSYLDSLEAVIALAPDTVTSYQLEIPLNTPLWRSLRDGSLTTEPASWEVKHGRMELGIDRLQQAGYIMCSAYAAARDPDSYRFAYQTEQYHGADLIGIGSSAFSHFAGVNQQNQASLKKYLPRLQAGELPLGRSYALSSEEQMVRQFALQLKLGRVEHSYFRGKFGSDPVERFAEPLAALQARGWLEFDRESTTLTRRGLVRVDRMIPAFYLPEHQGLRYS